MHLLSICSARPNFVKLAAVHHALIERNDPNITHTIVHTGQHYDPLFSDIFFEQLSIPMPAVNLGIHGGTREQVIQATDTALTPEFVSRRPDMVLVYGDVNGAVGAARAAHRLGIPIAHVEAGLRSFDLDMPEEINRMEIDRLSNVLLCSEASGLENLATEKVPGKAHLVGNTMIDTLIRMLPHIQAEKLPAYATGPFAVSTVHRPSNVDSPEELTSILQFLDQVSRECPIVLPVHHRLRAALDKLPSNPIISPQLHLVDPLGYVPFLALLQASAFILTDSGGIQEEATFLGKRCFTMRRNTERPSTIASGSNVLIHPTESQDQAQVFEFARSKPVISVSIPPYWDGKTGERILGIVCP